MVSHVWELYPECDHYSHSSWVDFMCHNVSDFANTSDEVPYGDTAFIAAVACLHKCRVHILGVKPDGSPIERVLLPFGPGLDKLDDIYIAHVNGNHYVSLPLAFVPQPSHTEPPLPTLSAARAAAEATTLPYLPPPPLPAAAVPLQPPLQLSAQYFPALVSRPAEQGRAPAPTLASLPPSRWAQGSPWTRGSKDNRQQANAPTPTPTNRRSEREASRPIS